MASIPSDGATDWGTDIRAFLLVGHDSDGTNKTNSRRLYATYEVENLAPGSDITTRPIFGTRQDVTFTAMGILTHGTPSGVDDSNTVVITIKNSAGTTMVTKTYNLATQPPTSSFGDLGTLTVAAFAADDYLTLTMTCGTTANMPAFTVVME